MSPFTWCWNKFNCIELVFDLLNDYFTCSSIFSCYFTRIKTSEFFETLRHLSLFNEFNMIFSEFLSWQYFNEFITWSSQYHIIQLKLLHLQWLCVNRVARFWIMMDFYYEYIRLTVDLSRADFLTKITDIPGDFCELRHVSCFVALSNIFSLVFNLTMNRLTTLAIHWILLSKCVLC